MNQTALWSVLETILGLLVSNKSRMLFEREEDATSWNRKLSLTISHSKLVAGELTLGEIVLHSTFGTLKSPHRKTEWLHKLARVPRWRAFNFAQVSFRCVLLMPSNSVIKKKLNFKERVCKSIDFWKKKSVHHRDSTMISWMQVSCSTHWAIRLWFLMECCSIFLHFFVFNLLQNVIWSPCSLAVTNLR